MKHALLTVFIFLLTLNCHAQKHDVFKVAHSCDSASVADQLLGVWVDTNNPFHQFVFQNRLLTEERISAYDTVTGEANWYITQGSVTSGAACEFTMFVTGIGNKNGILNFSGRTRCAMVGSNYFVVGLNAPDQDVYKRKQ
jgi:hypothetical protein